MRETISGSPETRPLIWSIDTLKENLADVKTIKIAGFGTFIVRKKAERKGRNLKTGEEIPIAPRKVVTFKPSNQFKEMVEKV